MKNCPLTRKLKEALAEHFGKRGTVHNVTGELVRVSMEDRLKCWEFFKEKTKRRGKEIDQFLEQAHAQR